MKSKEETSKAKRGPTKAEKLASLRKLANECGLFSTSNANRVAQIKREMEKEFRGGDTVR